jgi:hypothetical protein
MALREPTRVGATLVAVFLLASACTGSSKSDTARTATTGVPTADDLRPAGRFLLGPEDVIGDALTTTDSLWLAFRRGEQPDYHLARFDLRTTALRRVYDLPGEIGSGGMTSTGTRLWLATINEGDPAGTALLSLDLATDVLERIATLEGASNLATNGTQLWVRGEWRLQVRDPTTGALRAERNTPELGSGWVVSGAEGTWMTNRTVNALQQLDAVSVTRSVKLAPSESAPNRLTIGGGAVVVAQDKDIVFVNSETGVIELRVGGVGESVVGVALVGTRAVAAGADRLLVHDRRTGSSESRSLAFDEPVIAVVADSTHSVIVCEVGNECQRFRLIS